MNQNAEQHLARAADYVARGEEFYRKAAEEIVAAQQADPTLGYREIGEWFGHSKSWVNRVVRWSTSVPSTGQLPSSEEQGAVAKRHAKSVARKEPEALIEDAATRESLGRAFDEHYTKKAQESARHQHKREVEEHGGEDEYADHQHRQHIAEVVSVARGATSGWRFVAGQAKVVDDPGVRAELLSLADEAEGFVSMLRAVLRGDEITDSEMTELLGEKS
jgi:hypothetical protein